ncbi:MAG: ROK family protein, partial [Candidatus Paceibacterota bacterium]
MYICIDFGGTKTTVASVEEDGSIIYKNKIKTDHDYQTHIKNLVTLIKHDLKNDTKAVCLSVPGLIDREKGIVHALGNLPWKDESIRSDLNKSLPGVKIFIENDAKLGGLGEAKAVLQQYKRVLYLTIGTGIGGALIVDGRISKDLQDAEMGKMPLYYKNDQLKHWEDIISGRIIFEEYGKRASEIDNDKDWEEIGLRLAYGLGAVCSTLQPEVIIFGGGIGQFADKFSPAISKYLEDNLHSIVRKPLAYLSPKYDEDSV